MPDSTSPNDLTSALADTLRAALESVPQLVVDAEQVANRLAPGLSVRLAEAVEAAGVTAAALAQGLAIRSEGSAPMPAPSRRACSPRSTGMPAAGYRACRRNPVGADRADSHRARPRRQRAGPGR